MKGSAKLSYKQIKAKAQKQQQLKSNKQNKNLSSVFKCCYQFTKLFILLIIILTTSIVLLITLGSNQNYKQNDILQLFKKDSQIEKNKNELQDLLKQKVQSTYQHVINIHLPTIEQNQEFQQNQFKDLKIVSEFFLNQIHSEQKISIIPLNQKCVQWCGLVSEHISSKGLRAFKQVLRRALNYFNIKQTSKKKTSSSQSCFFSTIKQLIVKQKFSKVKQLIINQVWNFVNDYQNYVLYWKNDSGQMQNKKQGLKSLKKWIKQHDQSTIFILSQTSINEAFDTDSFKQYQLTTNFKSVESKNLQNIVPFWGSQQVATLKQQINSFYQLNQFLEFTRNRKGQLSRILSEKENNIVDKVCQHNHLEFYFYEGQTSAYQIMKKSKVPSEQRWQRQLEALNVKLSHLKSFLGINYIEDVFKTFTSNSGINLGKINQKGIQYDFQNHQFIWKDTKHKIFYELEAKRSCGRVQTQIQQKKQQDQSKQTNKSNQKLENQQQNTQQQENKDQAQNNQQIEIQKQKIQTEDIQENIEQSQNDQNIQLIKQQQKNVQQEINKIEQEAQSQEQVQSFQQINEETIEETTEETDQNKETIEETTEETDQNKETIQQTTEEADPNEEIIEQTTEETDQNKVQQNDDIVLEQKVQNASKKSETQQETQQSHQAQKDHDNNA